MRHEQMHILLINPNRYRQPPVPPVGLEYLVAPLRSAGHEVRILDLCFAPDPAAALGRALDDEPADLAGVTVRNVDTVLYHTNEFFLDEIAALVALVKARGIPVVIGGSGTATMPDHVRRYVGADCAVDGPGEGALPAAIDAVAAGSAPPVVNGWAAPPDARLRHTRGEFVDYAPYLDAGARFGFETQKGCRGCCIFCTEARKPVVPRDPAVVIDEIARLVENGVRELFCCDSEFNQALPHCAAFLDELIARSLPIDWTLYMKPLPHDARLFERMARSGCTSITLSVDTVSLCGHDPAYAEADVVSFLDLAARAGVKVPVDLTVGLPGEPGDAPARAIELFRRHRPSTVGVNAYLRLYPTMAMTPLVMSSPNLRRHIDPPDPDDPIRPHHYHHLDDDALERLIANDPLFRVEGRERGVNYERL